MRIIVIGLWFYSTAQTVFDNTLINGLVNQPEWNRCEIGQKIYTESWMVMLEMSWLMSMGWIQICKVVTCEECPAVSLQLSMYDDFMPVQGCLIALLLIEAILQNKKNKDNCTTIRCWRIQTCGCILVNLYNLFTMLDISQSTVNVPSV